LKDLDLSNTYALRDQTPQALAGDLGALTTPDQLKISHQLARSVHA
jgi:hypothetical protein